MMPKKAIPTPKKTTTKTKKATPKKNISTKSLPKKIQQSQPGPALSSPTITVSTSAPTNTQTSGPQTSTPIHSPVQQPQDSSSNVVKFSFIHHFSYGKMMMVLNAFAGILLGLFFALFIHWLGPIPNTGHDTQITFYNSLGWWNILVLPILYGILALATGVIIAGIYNHIVRKGGGIKATLLEKGEYRELKKFNILDIGVIEAILMAIMGIFVGLLFGIVLLLGGEKALGMRIVLFIIFLIIFPILYGVLGFIMGIIIAACYNLATRLVSGVNFLYKEETIKRLTVKSMALVHMMLFLYLGIIVGFLVGLIALVVALFGAFAGGAGTAILTFFGIWILVVVICVIMGVLIGVLSALLYNLAAKMVGGIKVKIE
jgi:hypothetical protein